MQHTEWRWSYTTDVWINSPSNSSQSAWIVGALSVQRNILLLSLEHREIHLLVYPVNHFICLHSHSRWFIAYKRTRKMRSALLKNSSHLYWMCLRMSKWPLSLLHPLSTRHVHGGDCRMHLSYTLVKCVSARVDNNGRFMWTRETHLKVYSQVSTRALHLWGEEEEVLLRITHTYSWRKLLF